MLKKENLKKVFILLFIIFLIYSIVYLCKGWNEFEFDFKINYFEILKIAVDITLVYYISYLLFKKDSIEKSEKDILIKYLEEFQDNKNTIIKSVNNYFDYQDVTKVQILTSDLKNLRTELNTKLDLLIENNYLLKNCDIELNLRTLLKNIWQDLTYEPERNASFNRDFYIQQAKANSTLIDKNIFNLIKIINSK